MVPHGAHTTAYGTHITAHGAQREIKKAVKLCSTTSNPYSVPFNLQTSSFRTHITTHSFRSSHLPRYYCALAQLLPKLPFTQNLTVDAQRAVPDNLLNQPLLLQISQSLPRKTAIDLQPIDEGGDGD